jgi:hypothetical protein
MTDVFLTKLDLLQPSQLYISTKKLDLVLKDFPSEPAAIEPIPIKKLHDETIYVDGHTRAFAAYLRGISEIPTYWEDEELDWEEYEICVQWCKDEGIFTIADLENRVISHPQYEKLWYARCDRMQKDLEQKRKQTRH